jgi:hypothetical protein
VSAAEALLVIVLPVFLLVGLGYGSVRLRVFPEAGIDGLIRFATNIAVPALLFRSIYGLDLGAAIDPRHLAGFYAAAVICFASATLASRVLWRRRPGESVATGFPALFSNSVLLGLPIFERAYGAGAAMDPVFAIIAFHAPACYIIGIVTMELARRDGGSIAGALATSAGEILKNALTIGILLGFAFNLGGVVLPGPVTEVLDLLTEAAIPVALFGLGGVLTRYRLRSAVSEALMVSAFSLALHPALAWLFTDQLLGLPEGFVRAAVVIAAMPPGVNGYVFAAMYGRAVGTAASTVLLGTALSVVTVTLWLGFLGGAAIG